MAKKQIAEEESVKKPKKELKKFKLKADFPPKKKGETVELGKEAETYFKSKKLI